MVTQPAQLMQSIAPTTTLKLFFLSPSFTFLFLHLFSLSSTTRHHLSRRDATLCMLRHWYRQPHFQPLEMIVQAVIMLSIVGFTLYMWGALLHPMPTSGHGLNVVTDSLDIPPIGLGTWLSKRHHVWITAWRMTYSTITNSVPGWLGRTHGSEGWIPAH